MKSFGGFIRSQTPNVSSWNRVGEQLGSNPGGVFEDETGTKHYVKYYDNPMQARSEVAAGHIYNSMGLKTLNHHLVNNNGRLVVASVWHNNLTPMDAQGYKNLRDKDQLARSFHAAILTKNWDSTGLHHDNISLDRNGNMVHLDMGGVFKFRAQGGPKPYDPDIGELTSLVNKDLNPTAHDAFLNVTLDHHKRALETTSKIDPNAVLHTFKILGLSDPHEHAQALIGRRDLLIKKFS